MNPQRRQRAFLRKVIDIHIGVLERSNRAGAEMTKVEVVAGADKGAELRASGASGSETADGRTAGVVYVVASIDSAIEIQPAIKPACVDSAATAVDVDVSARFQARPGVRVLSHDPDDQLIREPEINPKAHSAGRKVVAVGIVVAVHIYKITKPGDPDPPAVFRPWLQRLLHRTRGGLAVHGRFVVLVHRGPIGFHVGTEPV